MAKIEAGMSCDLAQFINPNYLSPKGMKLLQKSFAENEVILLKDFIVKSKFLEISKLAKSCDTMADFDGNFTHVPYTEGLAQNWALYGEPYRERFCQFEEADTINEKVGKSKLGKLGLCLRDLKRCFLSPSFLQWLCFICANGSELAPKNAQIRRFRPGLDYSRAKHVQKTDFFAKLTFCTDSEKWQSGDFGGHEIFAPKEDAQKAQQKAEVYEPVNSDLVSIEPENNTFSLVSTKENSLLEFVQYLSGGAPSSIFDVMLELNKKK
jgi:hypothetical protein